MKKTLITLITLVGSTLPHDAVLADASFEGTQNGIRRNSFELFGGAPAELAVDNTGRAYAALNAPNGAFCLANGASEWSDPAAGTDLGNVNALALGASAGTAFIIGGTSLFRTTDGCATWVELTGSSGSSDTNDYGFVLAFGHNTLLVGTRNGTLDRSVDNGASFTNVTVVGGAQNVVAVAPSPTSGKFFALVDVGGGTIKLFQSVNSGQTWSDTGKSGSYHDVAVDPLDATRIALSTNSGGVELSTNEGTSFTPLTAPDTSKKKVRFINSRLYKGNAYTDDTTNWSLLGESSSGADIVAPIAGHPTDSSVLYVGTELGIALTTNSGASFADANQGIYAVTVQDIAQAENKNVLYLATAQGLAKTSNFLNDDGPTWTFPVTINPSRAYQGVSAIHLDSSDPNRAYAGLLGGELYFSTNAGASWTQSTMDSIGGADITDIAQTTNGTLYASYRSRGGNSGGVLRSVDAGATWSIISTGSVSIDCNSIAVVNNAIFVGTGDDQDQSNPASGVYTFDGTNWTKLTGAVDGQLVTDIVSIGSTLIAASAADSDQSGGVFRSADAGTTWTDVTSRGLRENGGWYRTLAVDPVNTDIVFVAHGRPAGSAEVYYSQDGGATWARMYEGLIDEVPEVMLVDDLTVGSGVGFTGLTVNKKVRLLARVTKGKLTCTLKSGNRALRGQKVSMEVKSKKSRKFKRSSTRTTPKTGKVTFSVKKFKRGSQVRCRFITTTSSKKNV